MRNRFKSIVVTDRHGVLYVKNFTIWGDGSVSLQRWDSKQEQHIRNVPVEKIRRQACLRAI